ncbi:DUF4232 domain-containing protein [Kribbella sp. NBC_01245]|uniref:DUF4232 domain-containing protein n=1 Tax=Kribbella sp. NBC_01245 TaxID=2903578 RepID=UPI002E2945F1|nr:DUF4232 domain-containing protein [Kribbella sp. NBC_01245]
MSPGSSPKRATPRPAKCLPNGHLITRSEIDAAIGLRAVTLSLRNCGKRPLVVHGHPAIAVLDRARRPFPITVTRETPDGPPETLQLKPGQTLIAVLTWRNTVTDDDSILPMQAAYLRVAAGQGNPTTLMRRAISPCVMGISSLAAAFGKDDVERVKQFLQAYQQAGGSILVAPEDLMLHRVAAELSKITEQIRAVLGDQDGPIPGWIDLDKADDRITVGLNRFSEVGQGMRAPGLSR